MMFDEEYDDYNSQQSLQKKRQPKTLWDMFMEVIEEDESQKKKKFIEVID